MTNTREEVALLPCPFCGKEPKSRIGYPDTNWIGCFDCIGGVATKYGRDSKILITAWNTRADNSSKYIAGLVEALKAITGYAQHDDDCKINDWQFMPECTCGYTDAWGRCQEALNNLPEELRG